MDSIHITHYSANPGRNVFEEFEEAVYHSGRLYSLRHFVLIGLASRDDLMAALKKSMEVCALAGINIRQHYKPVYVFDLGTGATHTDWLMSKKGFNLMIIQAPLLNEQIARWLCELAG